MRFKFVCLFAAFALVLGFAALAWSQAQSIMTSDEIARKLGGGGTSQPPSGVKLRQITVGPAGPAAAPAQAAPAQQVAPAAPMVQTAPPAASEPEERASSKKTKKAAAAPAAPASGSASVMLHINFNSGSAELSDTNAKAQLDALGGALAKPELASATFEIAGHTDSVGGDGYNMHLSQQRANFIKNYIVSHYGVAAGRLKAMGYGKNSPVASNDTEEGRAQNRRVVITRLN